MFGNSVVRRASTVRVLIFVALTVPLVPLQAFAQQSVDYASISGRVTDSSGATVPGALVEARHTHTNVVGSVVTDQEGRFRFPYLRVGPYRHHGQALGLPGCEPAVDADGGFGVRAADRSVGERARGQRHRHRRGDGARGRPQSDCRHRFARPKCRACRSTAATSSSSRCSCPASRRPTSRSTQLFPETSAVPGVSLSVSSQRNLSNNFIVDGLSANDDAAALSGITYGVDAVEQFQVITSGAQAELGRALGGYVNVVTKSGTNALRGTVYDYLRDDRFNAKNALSGTTLPMDQSQFGGSLGGPIVREPHVLFRQRRTAPARSDRPRHDPRPERRRRQRAARGGWLSAAPLIATGIYPNPVDSTNVLGKVDHQVSGQDQFSVRYSLYDVRSRQLARRRRVERAERVVGPRQPRSGGGDRATR